MGGEERTDWVAREFPWANELEEMWNVKDKLIGMPYIPEASTRPLLPRDIH